MNNLKYQYEEWIKVITEEEKIVVKKYVTSFLFRHYRKMNNALRNGTDKCSDEINVLSTALNRTQLDQDVILYRQGHKNILRENGLDNISFPYLELIGKTVVEKGFMSTSRLKGVIFSKGNLSYEIEAPKGTKGVYVTPMNLKIFAWEQEVLFDKGMRMKILKVENRKNHLKLYVRLLSED